MEFERYTDRAKGFVQAAQNLALREGHQQFAPEHLLKVLLDDPEGLAAGLIERAGGRSREALAAVERLLAKRPKVSGGGAGQLYLSPDLARLFDNAQKIAEKAGDKFVTAERLAAGARDREELRRRAHPRRGRCHARRHQCGDQRDQEGPNRRQRVGRAGLRCAQALRARSDRGGGRTASSIP